MPKSSPAEESNRDLAYVCTSVKYANGISTGAEGAFIC